MTARTIKLTELKKIILGLKKTEKDNVYDEWDSGYDDALDAIAEAAGLDPLMLDLEKGTTHKKEVQ